MSFDTSAMRVTFMEIQWYIRPTTAALLHNEDRVWDGLGATKL